MRNFILIFIFLFALTGSYANNFSNYELKNSSFEQSIEDKISVDNLNKIGINNISIEVKYVDETSCIVTITGTIDIAGNGIEISVEATADTCSEATAEAINGVKAIKNQIEGLFSE